MKSLLLAIILVVCVAAEQKHYDGDIDEDGRRLYQRARKRKAMGKPLLDLDQFQPYQDVMYYLDYLVGDCAAGLTSTVNIAGQSQEGRDLKTLTLSISPAANRPIYFTDRMTHAQEWITVATLLKVIEHMCYNYGSDTTVTHLLDTYDFVFMPIEDPDGYEFTWSHDGMGRKNHGVDNEVGSSCIGVDVNRNPMWERAIGSTADVCTDQDCVWLSDCSDDKFCSTGNKCCTPDGYPGCYGHCTYLSDCAEDSHCPSRYHMCCEPPPDEVCYGHCTYLSDCGNDRYCHGNMYMCCAPPPDMDCLGHCTFQDDCMSTTTYCSDMYMCCTPPWEMGCIGKCFYLSDCATTSYCHSEFQMCCQPDDAAQCLGHCTYAGDDICGYDEYCNMTYKMCCFDPSIPKDSIAEITDEASQEDYGVKYPFCIEIRGNSFVRDPSEIQPSFEEIWSGIVAAIQENETEYNIKHE